MAHQEAWKLIPLLKHLRFGDHISLFYRDRTEQFSVAMPYIKSGLANGEKCIYIAEESTPSDIKYALEKEGIDVEKYLNSGQLRIMVPEDFYLKPGYFSPDEVIDSLEENTNLAIKEGYKGLRGTGEMSWALRKLVDSERLIEYESKLNRFSQKGLALGICQYNVGRFQEEILLDVIKTHPIVITDGLICKNPYYTPPNEFFEKERAKAEFNSLIKNLQWFEQEFKGWSCERLLREHERKAICKFIDEVLDLDDKAREAFLELFIKKRYGSFTFLFKAGECIGVDWQSSHRTHKM